MPYAKTHPWLGFALNTKRLPARVWLALGECRSKCEHLAGVPLKPVVAQQLHRLYLAKGVHATTAIEGNTLSERQVMDRIDGKETLPQSQEYLGKEIDNVLAATNTIMAVIAKDGAQTITVAQIKEYNRIVLDGLEAEPHVEPGKFRDVDVGVMDYRAVPHGEIDELMDRLCAWLNSPGFQPEGDDAIVGGIIKSVVAHIYLAWIHPFGDGNGRTARLLEVRFLMEAGVPSAAIHLLSNHYNRTRAEYYRRLSEASKSGGDLANFVLYAATGLRDLLREQLRLVKYQQWRIAWDSYAFEVMGERRTSSDRRQLKLLLALGNKDGFVPRNELRRLTPELAELYAGKTAKTLTRDVNALVKRKLIAVDANGAVRAAREIILAFLPTGKKGSVEAQIEESARLIDEGGRPNLTY